MDKTVSACTADLCDQYGGRLAVSASPLRHFGGVRAFSGAAVTLRSHEDNVRLKELIARDGRGRVIVVDAGGRANCAMVGGDMAARALDHGWTGLVILGGVRDVAELRELEIGIMALGTCPRKSRKDGIGEVGVAIDLSGALVRPKALVACDEDGLVVLPREL